jgi:hypothetical protein
MIDSEKIFRRIRKNPHNFHHPESGEILSRVFFVYIEETRCDYLSPRQKEGGSREYFSLPSLQFFRSHKISSQFSHGLSLFFGEELLEVISRISCMSDHLSMISPGAIFSLVKGLLYPGDPLAERVGSMHTGA